MGRGGSRGASWEQEQEEEVGEEGKSNGSQRRVHFAAPHQAILAAGEAWQGSATKEREREGRVEGATEAGSSWSRQQQEEEEWEGAQTAPGPYQFHGTMVTIWQ